MNKIYEKTIRALFFKFDPEKGHEIVKKFARFPIPTFCRDTTELNVRIKNYKFRNPVGLAAGFDKDAKMISLLSSLGFGYLVIGSVLKQESMGNPKPRIVRYENEQSMVNSMGLPSVGIDKFVKNYLDSIIRTDIFISIAGNTLKEFIDVYKIVKKLTPFIELNLSCPNTENGRLFQDADNFETLAEYVSKLKDGIIFVKVSPVINRKDAENLITIVELCKKFNIDGITAVNALPVKEKSISVGYGGLSGKKIFNFMLNTINLIKEYSNDKLILNACGGIFNSEDAFKALILGASTVQVYTSLIYKGPCITCEIKKGINVLLKKNGFKNLEEVIGYKSKLSNK